jgi:putative flavoprotein involved in K+ transport
MPYLPFPDDWPVFSPKDKIADWLESYVKVMELDYWSSTEAKSATYDEESGTWTVTVTRDGEDRILKPTHLVLATGMSGIPNLPDVPGADRFRGDIHHSSKHPGGAKYRGKKAVVVGSNNSAHDICGDLWENGADVTMLQRSSTHIVKSDSLMTHTLGPLYSEDAVEAGIDHDTSSSPRSRTGSSRTSSGPPSTRSGSRTRSSTRRSRRPASCSTSARTTPGCS